MSLLYNNVLLFIIICFTSFNFKKYFLSSKSAYYNDFSLGEHKTFKTKPLTSHVHLKERPKAIHLSRSCSIPFLQSVIVANIKTVSLRLIVDSSSVFVCTAARSL